MVPPGSADHEITGVRVAVRLPHKCEKLLKKRC